jgi:hypothetical protein
MYINYEMLWIRLKDAIKSGDVTFEGQIADCDLLSLMDTLEQDEKD